MSDFDVIAQPMGSTTVSDILYAALADDRFNELRAAVAYITASGVQELQQALGRLSAEEVMAHGLRLVPLRPGGALRSPAAESVIGQGPRWQASCPPSGLPADHLIPSKVVPLHGT